MKNLWRVAVVVSAVTAFAFVPRASLAAGTGSPAIHSGVLPRIASSFLRDATPHTVSCEPTEFAGTADLTISFRAVPLSLAVADFTGDSHPDLAAVGFDRVDASRGYYVIEIALSEGRRQSLTFAAPPGGVLITPKDLTGDGNLDLVIRSAVSRLPVAVFFNDGCGHFSTRPDGSSSTAARALFPSMDFTAHFDSGRPLVATLTNRVIAPFARSVSPSIQRVAAIAISASDFAPTRLADRNSGRAPPFSRS